MPNHPHALSWPPLPDDDLHHVACAGSGRFLVTTASTSRYLIDLDAATATRFPGAGPSLEWNVAPLRGDGAERTLLALVCALGSPMVMLLAIGEASMPTVRRTTPVLSIEAVDYPPDTVP